MAQVNINTVFNPTDRSIDNLTSVYYNRDKLVAVIKKSLNLFIQENNVKNKTVLLKPNWVTHSRKPENDLCLRTHNNFVLAALECVLEMQPRKVIIGDAPIQGCQWSSLFQGNFSQQLKTLEQKSRIPVILKDFRRRILDLSKNQPFSDLRSLSDYLIFDLGKDSYLEPITIPGVNRFRVTNYNPDRMHSAHSKGSHKYCIVKDFLNADVVISLPKLKTHQKTGITGALKNIVGINGDKDFLPHHRLGGTKFNGDCYPGGSPLRYCSELAMDIANRRQGTKRYLIWQKLSTILWKSSFPGDVHQFSAGWFGNDTTWRMVLDLNTIATFGKIDGTLSSEKQREIISLSDGIIGGQGNGPLYPEPLALGIVMISDNPVLNDFSVAALMGFDPLKFPMLRAVRNSFIENESKIFMNDNPISFNELRHFSAETEPPPGWKKYLDQSSIY